MGAPVDAAELHPLCSMLLLARAAKGETVAITKGTYGCHGALEGFGLAPACPERFPGGGQTANFGIESQRSAIIKQVMARQEKKSGL